MKAFKTRDVVSLGSGILMGSFGDMAEIAEYFAEQPVFTHQYLAVGPVAEKALREKYPWVEAVGEEVTERIDGFGRGETDRIVTVINEVIERLVAEHGETLDVPTHTEHFGEPFKMSFTSGLENLGKGL